MKKLKIAILSIALMFLLAGCRVETTTTVSGDITPVDNIKPIEMHLPDENSKPREEEVDHIVIHFVSNANNDQENPFSVDEVYNIFKEYTVSSNYLIDRDGEVYLFVEEDRVAYHAGRGELHNDKKYTNKLNEYSIGIELMGFGTKEEMIPIIGEENANLLNYDDSGFTDEQYEALNLLIDDIITRNPKIEKNVKYIIGHNEYNKEKTDPGSLFDWKEVGL